MITKGQRIKTLRPVEGFLKEGMVLSNRNGKISVVTDDGLLLSGDEAAFLPSDTPIPPHFLLRKNDRVEWEDPATKSKRFGVVSARRSHGLEVVEDGGEKVVFIPYGQVFPSSEPLAIDTKKTPMDCYEVRKFKSAEHLSEETLAFSAEIWKAGRPILRVSNDGHGGSNRIVPLEGYNYDVVHQAVKDSSEWFEAFTGRQSAIETLDTWVLWFATKRPYGVTAEDYLKEFCCAVYGEEGGVSA
jgi:hypothetical protein